VGRSRVGRSEEVAAAAAGRGGRGGSESRIRVPVTNDAQDLDRLIHEPMRLGIMSALAVNESLSFNDLKGVLQATDGNLSVHARRLEDAGYLTCTKGFEGRTPRTEFRLTAVGRKALQSYLDHMEALIKATREG
jgi:DNA-binding MarR family transcriptional regulator